MADEIKKDTAEQRDLSKSVTDMLKGLYRRAYMTQPDAKDELDASDANISDTVERIISDSSYKTGLNNISTLYAKLLRTNGNGSTNSGDMSEIFGGDMDLNGSLYNAFFNNKNLKDYDAEIDMICKYMPKLDAALSTLLDNVLSADHFAKDYITLAETNFSMVSDQKTIVNNVELIKHKYNLAEKFQDIAYRAMKYGEEFVYIIPYSTAISRLYGSQQTTNVVKESVDFDQNFITNFQDSDPKNKINFNDFKINLSYHNGLLNESIVANIKATERLKSIQEQSFNEAYVPVLEAMSDTQKASLQKDTSISNALTPKDELDVKDFFEPTPDGITDPNKAKKYGKEIKAAGALFKVLKRENVVPIYIDDICLGYYYIEGSANNFLDKDSTYPMSGITDPMNSMAMSKSPRAALKNSGNVNDNMLRGIAAKISGMIDAQFIKMNKDLSREIYAILKYNNLTIKGENSINVTFISPDDLVHCYYVLDPDSHRGVSLLNDSMIPAKLYTGMYISNTLATMSRGYDRRVYYVKNSGVDTNISQLLLQTMKQIKMTNFNIRRFENMNNVLNIIGQFNDFIIPTNASGESPVQFEIMQGQNIDPQTELMQKLEDMAVDATTVPVEIVNARNSLDYAVQASMTSSKFLKTVISDQIITNAFFSRIMTQLYRAEYDDAKAIINVSLPQPSYLNTSNTSTMINNMNDMVQAIADSYSEDFTEEMKPLFLANIKKEMLRTYIDQNMVDRVAKQTKLQLAAKSTNDNDNDSSGGGDY
nr:MAG TPA: Portal protein [Caudoviricetes sp.]